jgi:hypothetical protein
MLLEVMRCLSMTFECFIGHDIVLEIVGQLLRASKCMLRSLKFSRSFEIALELCMYLYWPIVKALRTFEQYDSHLYFIEKYL